MSYHTYSGPDPLATRNNKSLIKKFIYFFKTVIIIFQTQYEFHQAWELIDLKIVSRILIESGRSILLSCNKLFEQNYLQNTYGSRLKKKLKIN